MKGRKAQALRLLDIVIEDDLPLFRDADPSLNEERRMAWLFKIDLLQEWGRISEALAWTCLECELNPQNVVAQAMKERLKRALGLEDPSEPGRPVRKPTSLRMAWCGVAGMRDVKAVLERDVILPLQEPLLYERYKVDLPNGILLYGPSGCGKTFIARKLAEYLRFTFIEIKPSDLASIYVHGSQEKIGQLFASARKRAPTLLFFDELDALVPDRSGGNLYHSYSAEVNEFLVQLNECWKSKVLIVGATNLIDKVDPAARRPGRLDKKVFVGPPDTEARAQMLRMFSKDRPCARIDYLRLADETDLYSAAEVEELVNEAARRALEDRRDIETADVLDAMQTVRRSLTAESVQKMMRAGD